MTPMHLERLLEIYCSHAKVSCPHVTRPTGSETPLEDLRDDGMIEREPIRHIEDDEHGWRITDRGRFYIEAILAIPIPEIRWAIPERGRSVLAVHDSIRTALNDVLVRNQDGKVSNADAMSELHELYFQWFQR